MNPILPNPPSFHSIDMEIECKKRNESSPLESSPKRQKTEEHTNGADLYDTRDLLQDSPLSDLHQDDMDISDELPQPVPSLPVRPLSPQDKIHLKNGVGVDCYLDATLLILAGIPKFREMCKTSVDKVRDERTKQLHSALLLFINFWETGDQRQVTYTRNAIRKLLQTKWAQEYQGNNYRQQDASACAMLFLDAVGFEPFIESDEYRSARPDSPYQPKTQPMHCLHLPIVTSADSTPSNDAILKFSDMAGCYTAPSKDERNQHHRLTLSKPQPLFMVAFNRFTSGVVKLKTKVLFSDSGSPNDVIDLGLLFPEGTALYRIKGFAVHEGFTAISGHYIAYRRNDKGVWLSYNDHQGKVTLVTEEECKAALPNAYYVIFEQGPAKDEVQDPPTTQPTQDLAFIVNELSNKIKDYDAKLSQCNSMILNQSRKIKSLKSLEEQNLRITSLESRMGHLESVNTTLGKIIENLQNELRKKNTELQNYKNQTISQIEKIKIPQNSTSLSPNPPTPTAVQSPATPKISSQNPASLIQTQNASSAEKSTEQIMAVNRFHRDLHAGVLCLLNIKLFKQMCKENAVDHKDPKYNLLQSTLIRIFDEVNTKSSDTSEKILQGIGDILKSSWATIFIPEVYKDATPATCLFPFFGAAHCAPFNFQTTKVMNSGLHNVRGPDLSRHTHLNPQITNGKTINITLFFPETQTESVSLDWMIANFNKVSSFKGNLFQHRVTQSPRLFIIEFKRNGKKTKVSFGETSNPNDPLNLSKLFGGEAANYQIEGFTVFKDDNYLVYFREENRWMYYDMRSSSKSTPFPALEKQTQEALSQAEYAILSKIN